MNREEIARIQIGHTEIAPGSARVLAVVFLLTLIVVPAVQLAGWLQSGCAADLGDQFPMLRSLALPLRAIRAGVTTSGSMWTRLEAGNRSMLQEINDIERDLGEASVVGKALRPYVQEVLVTFGWGSEQVRLGDDGWLFYEPAMDYLTGDGFLDPFHQARRVRETPSWQDPPAPDPLPAILELAGFLDARGINLLLVPVPVKAGVVPGRLAAGAMREGVLHNASWPEFVDRLGRAGVMAEDVGADIEGLSHTFLKTDTHWRWQAVDAVAQRIAVRLRTLGVGATTVFEDSTEVISNRGDLAQMLPLAFPTRFPDETVEIRPVVGQDPGGEDSGGPVLLMGDSFSNIYSDSDLGWGARAGLGERLAWHLQAPVTRIVRNNDGAFATRLELARRLDQDPTFLDGVQVVVWQFTERELSLGDWRSFDLGNGSDDLPAFIFLRPGEKLRIDGVIAAMGEPPDPVEAAYPDYLRALHLVEVRSADALQHGEALVFVWAMRGYELLPGANYQVGEQVRMVIRPWSDVASSLGTVTRGEIFEERLLMQSPCWGEEVNK